MVRFLSAAALLALAVPASAATCATVKGKLVVRDAQAKIVKQHVHTKSEAGGTEFVGWRYVGCARPRGKTHTLGTSGINYLYADGRRRGVFSGASSKFSKLKGTYVYERVQYASNTAQGREGVVHDVASGKHYGVYADGDFGDGPGPPLSWRLDAGGIFAGIYEQADQHLVRAFTAARGAQDLDTAPAADIPASSLTLTDSTVGWTNAGRPETADVS
jgi:hypothetical protein